LVCAGVVGTYGGSVGYLNSGGGVACAAPAPASFLSSVFSAAAPAPTPAVAFESAPFGAADVVGVGMKRSGQVFVTLNGKPMPATTAFAALPNRK
jgi:hypothetical protein